MSVAVPILAVVGALLALVAAAPLARERRRRAAQVAVGVGWIGVLAGVAGFYTGAMSGLATLLGTAACGGLAVLPAGIQLDGARDFAVAAGGIIALVVGASGFFADGPASVDVSQASLLYVAHFGALGAALVCALAGCVLFDAANDSDRPEPGGGTIMAVVALVGAAVLVHLLGGGFEGGTSVSDLLPELSLLAAAVALALLAGVYRLRLRAGEAEGEAGHQSVYLLHGRDYALRAVLLSWLVILLGGLVHWNHFGAIGVGSPAEWNAVGAVLGMTGLVLIGWSRHDDASDKTKISALIDTLAPAAIFSVLVITVALSVGFHAPFGLSIVF
ncbi:MAG: hypothetical protein ACLFVJ_05475 [Persicimonas sp.]